MIQNRFMIYPHSVKEDKQNAIMSYLTAELFYSGSLSPTSDISRVKIERKTMYAEYGGV